VFGALISKADRDFCFVSGSFDLNNNTLTKYCVHHIVSGPQANKMIGIARFSCGANCSFRTTTI
jgi:hypothetical protein